MPRKAAKPIPPRAASDRTRTVNKNVKANVAIDANYGNKRVKHLIIIENSSDNDSSDDDLEEPIRKKKPPPASPETMVMLACMAKLLGESP